MTTAKALLAQLSEIREASGLTPSAVAALIEVAPNTVLRIEKGKSVTLENFAAVAQALGYEVALRQTVFTDANKLKTAVSEDVNFAAAFVTTIGPFAPAD